MDTLEIVKAETAEGQGGEKDVPGVYADLMLKTWELTGQTRFLTEAKRSVRSLKSLGFDAFYQANTTTIGAVALLKLFKQTGDKKYLELSYVSLASVFKNTHIWECNYGFGKNFSSFFAVFPLKDAPYSAAYEELEVYAAMHEYLRVAKDVEILPSVRLLIAEFIKYAVGRLQFYYPTQLPKEMVATTVKTGEMDQTLWIALEDLRDGWETSGTVGQEVYGAGVGFGILPRQYFRVPDNDLIIFIEYPVCEAKVSAHKASFTIDGDERLTCRLRLLQKQKTKISSFNIEVIGGHVSHSLPIAEENDEMTEYMCKGKQRIRISWK